MQERDKEREKHQKRITELAEVRAGLATAALENGKLATERDTLIAKNKEKDRMLTSLDKEIEKLKASHQTLTYRLFRLLDIKDEDEDLLEPKLDNLETIQEDYLKILESSSALLNLFELSLQSSQLLPLKIKDVSHSELNVFSSFKKTP